MYVLYLNNKSFGASNIISQMLGHQQGNKYLFTQITWNLEQPTILSCNYSLTDHLMEDWTNSGETNHTNMNTTKQFW